jgi:ectoine hydroxylase-related dioxygenase (phytanoyl-CoA dioxygenase family)
VLQLSSRDLKPEIAVAEATRVSSVNGAAFARDGYVVLERFIEPPELSEIRAEVESVVARPHNPSCVRPHNTLLPLRWNDRIVSLLLSSRRRVAALSGAIAADDLRWVSGYVSVKDAHSEPLWWHQDWWCWDHPISYSRVTAQVAVLCYLTDTSAGNGALRVLPRSHHASSSLHAFLPEAHAPDADLSPDHPAADDHEDQVTLAVRAGDAVVLDYRLLHGTHANGTGERRDCIVLTLTPAWRQLPEDIRGHLISHPALPAAAEDGSSAPIVPLLPVYAGPRRDLPLNRVPPSRFTID